MNILRQYIAQLTLVAIFMVFVVLGVIEFLLTFLNEISYQRAGSYQTSQALQYVLLTAPSRWYEYSPITVLVGCLIALGAMANNSEITVIRAAGVSLWRILYILLQPVILLLVLMFVLGELIAPPLEIKAQHLKQNSAAQGSTKYGVWHKEGDAFYFFNAVNDNGAIKGFTKFQLDENGRLQFKQQSPSVEPGESQWQISNSKKIAYANERWVEVNEASTIWQTDLSAQVLAIESLEPSRMSVFKLYQYTQYLKEQELGIDLYGVAFWNKLLQPVLTLALVLIAASFVFGPMRSVPVGNRIFTGIIVGVVLKLIQNLLAPASVAYDVPAIVATSTPIIICFLIGGVLLKRAS